ncbi:Mitochondrial carrier domain,Mitochondrial substrate/solute carrier [Cinara cedri]|uniref:Mitochondrial carrier domain,Mitochondrial substrate/solute carrier n=1 Tax=Cinara cedri TaxID=506608 RepID=A0A5E4N5T7_9HEMI|nr:Mitochondrial carrier domain,Mitochondrial substrate/solute carrier [Cinara cedri]
MIGGINMLAGVNTGIFKVFSVGNAVRFFSKKTEPSKLTSPLKSIINQYKTGSIRLPFRRSTLLMKSMLIKIWDSGEIKREPMPKYISLKTGLILLSIGFSKPIFEKVLADTPSSNIPIDLGTKILPMCNFVSGWAAGVVSLLVSYPIDTVRVVQQVTNTGAVKCIRHIYKEHKFAGFYRGMIVPFLCTGVVKSVSFGTNGWTMRLIQSYRGTDDINIRYCCDANNNMNQLNWHFDMFVAGATGGFFATAISAPFEVVKLLLQASSTQNATYSFSCLIVSIKYEYFRYIAKTLEND